jgi:uncharacterized protein with GYD domain
MATYISLIRFTEQGIKNIKESPTRLEAARKMFEKAGAKLKEFYLVTGQYDAIVISEAPDDTAVAKLLLSLGERGNVRSETLRAFNESEYRKIISSLP